MTGGMKWSEKYGLYYSSIFQFSKHSWFNIYNLLSHSRRVVGTFEIDHFAVMGLVPQPSFQCEAKVDLVLMQTPFVFLWELC